MIVDAHLVEGRGVDAIEEVGDAAKLKAVAVPDGDAGGPAAAGREDGEEEAKDREASR
jgi:hypothetical protein